MIFGFPELALAQLFLIGLGIYWTLKRNDDLPLLISTAIFYFSSYRYWAVTSGITSWIDLGYWLTIVPITDAAALRCLHYIVLGEICLLGSYMLCQREALRIMPRAVNPEFLSWLRPKLLVCGLAALPLVVLLRSAATDRARSGASGALGGGYLSLPPLALIGISALLFCLWKFKGLPKWKHKLLFGLIVLSIANLTFKISSRFQFLGWIAAGMVIFTSSLKPQKRLVYLVLLGIGGLILTIWAGVLRTPEIAQIVYSEGLSLLNNPLVRDVLFERLFGAVDANMLDGFVILEDVYPRLLPFSFGKEHLEILLRPIPRNLWPDKPLGGYMNKLGFTDPQAGTIGISPSIFGDFYAECGVLGVFVLSILYGVGLAALMRYSNRLHPFACILLRAIITAGVVPLLRGGDLPGITVWLLMSFWPCFLLLIVQRGFFEAYVPPQRNKSLLSKLPSFLSPKP